MSKHRHFARKRFGQHFLSDLNTLDKIIRAIHPTEQDHLIEIGPGRGALTDKLLEANPKQLDIIEIDRDLVELLTQQYSSQQVTIISADATKFDFSTLTHERCRVVGNLPYNVSTPLLFQLFKSLDNIQDMHFLLQKEVVDRMVALPGSKDYGRLSVMVQYYCQAKRLFNVGPQVFTPPPKVDSAVVRLVPLIAPEHAQHTPDFSLIVREAFNHRRKTLKNSLQTWLSGADIQAAGVDPGQRPEQLSLHEFIALANKLTNK